MRNILVIAVVIWSSMFNLNAQSSSINWMTIEEVTEAQKDEPRKVMMDVYTKWCGPCKMMMANTFTNPELIKYVNENYYAVKLNAEHPDPITFRGEEYSNPTYVPNKPGRNGVHELSRALGVNAYPTIVYFDEDFTIITPISGYKQPRQLQVLLTFFNEVYSSEIPSEKMQPMWDKYNETFVGTW
ncbi:MAG: thioredoxin family protein [Bacteroidetes bacterium]|nr:MAG: thioredoxin family protein [Bacteroidota bacterium]